VRARHRVRRVGPLRAVSGVLAAGMVALVGGLVVAYVVALQEGAPGPGAVTLLVHAVTAVLAVVAQVFADRTPGPRGAWTATGVIVAVGAVLTVEWLF
jgi:uncharacterized membrane-anchored protein